MFEARLDQANKLLRVGFSKHVEPDEAKACTEAVKKLLASAPAGFRLVTDLTGLEFMDLGCAPYIRKAMKLFNQAGVSKVVRIIPDPKKDIGLNILSKFHYRRGIPIVTCETEAEAIKALAE